MANPVQPNRPWELIQQNRRKLRTLADPAQILAQTPQVIVEGTTDRDLPSAIHRPEWDYWVVSSTVDKTFDLSFLPVTDSEEVTVRGLRLDPSSYSISGQTLTLGADVTLRVNDTVAVHYWTGGATVPSPLSIPLHTNWLYKTGLTNTPATYAAVGFDDTSWTSGPTPYWWYPGGPTGPNTKLDSLGTQVGTSGPLNVWARIHCVSAGGALTIVAPCVDNSTWVYVDGVQVAAWSDVGDFYTIDTSPWKVTVSAAAGPHVIAFYGTDDGATAGYAGVAVTEAV